MSTTAQKTRIGYYNPHEYPVAWSSRCADQGPTMLDSGEPVCDDQGFLIAESPELNEQVADGMLAYITDDMPNFKDWNKIRKQQLSGNLRPALPDGRAADGGQMAMADREAPKAPEVPEATVSSTKGVIADNEEAVAAMTEAKPEPAPEPPGETLPEGVKDLGENTYQYDNMVFDSRSALDAYIEMQKSDKPG